MFAQTRYTLEPPHLCLEKIKKKKDTREKLMRKQ